jgi:hypothetical protein
MKVFAICLSWGFSEWYGRIAGVIEEDMSMLVIPLSLMAVSGACFVIYMAALKTKSV